MKSPNVYSTSFARASRQTADSTLRRTFRAFALTALVCSLACCACSSANSRLGSHKDNPYAKYDPKTPQEEAYYRDVYSGDWHEGSMAGETSICKQSASTQMPEHWTMLPPGARTMSEIRSEASQRKLSSAMGAPYKAGSQRQTPLNNVPDVGGYQVASTQGSYASQSQVPASSSTTNVSVSSQSLPSPSSYASTAPTSPGAYAPQAPATSSYAPQAAAAPGAYASQTSAASSYAPRQVASSGAYVSQTPATSSYGSQAVASPGSYAPQTSVAPSAYAPQTTTRSNVSYQGASIDLFASQERIIRGQAPEDDPFADDAEAEEDPFADDADDSGADEETTVEEEEVEVSSVETKEEPVAKPNVEMKEENVTAKNVAANAVVVPSGRPGAVQVQPVVVHPSIAAPFAKINRPVNKAHETDNSNAKRGEQDEYVVSGGDANGEFYSREDWSYENLDPEDSVAHFDTIDGRILVEPSNKLFIYSPRFGAVRQTLAPIEGDHRLALETAISTDEPTLNESAANVDVRTQEIKPLGAGSIQNVEGAEARMAPAVSTGSVGVLEADAQIRLGALLTSETIDDLSSEDSSLMLDGAVAAQSWDGEQGVAVSTELVNVFSNAYVEGAATIFSIKDDTKTSKLRVIKIANKDAAKPGEFVEFTLRFENIGDETIGNVTILDNLSSRLRYVDGTAKSSVQADFSANLSESGSLVLRWEITAPLEPKEFGVAKFICKVW